MIITDRGRGTTTTVSNRLHRRLMDYARDNRLSIGSVVEQLREEIHRTSAPEQPAATTIDADGKLAYFTEVLKQLDALREWAPEDSTLSKLTTKASEPIGGLVGCLLDFRRQLLEHSTK